MFTPHAQFAMGILHENGSGVAQDSMIAEEWYAKACMKGMQKSCVACERLKKERRGGS